MYEGLHFMDNDIASTIETEMKFAWESTNPYPYFYQWSELSIDDVNDIIWRIKSHHQNISDAIKYVIGPALDQHTLDILEEEDMSLDYSCASFLVRWQSPAGEDFNMDIDAESFISDFVSQAENFDADDHAELFIRNRGQHGIPTTIREILEDAEAIAEKLQHVAERLNSLDD